MNVWIHVCMCMCAHACVLMDAEHSEWPSTINHVQEEARVIILANRRVTTEEITLQLGFSQGTA